MAEVAWSSSSILLELAPEKQLWLTGLHTAHGDLLFHQPRSNRRSRSWLHSATGMSTFCQRLYAEDLQRAEHKRAAGIREETDEPSYIDSFMLEEKNAIVTADWLSSFSDRCPACRPRLW